MTPPGKGAVIIHGHFYQPPRENPWTGVVDKEANAAPDHDWNARITRECYLPLAALGVYEQISFDVGPTLLDWMEREAPELYERILRADRDSVTQRGAGNALAMPYHHVILPLCSRRDKETEVRWGLADFRRRFGREPVGFWLPETAVDRETLEVLAAEGIAFTVLAPHQVARPPAGGLPGTVHLGDGRSIAVFAYDGSLSHAVAFGGFVADPARWIDAVRTTPPGTVRALAVDGETFGHHHKGGDRTLGTVLDGLRQGGEVAVTNFAAILAARPPAETVELVAPSSWSCAHGVERWRTSCGCKITPGAHTQQDWRAPLRVAVDWLAEEIHRLYEREAAAFAGNGDPWALRDAAGGAADVDGVNADPGRLLEMERGVLRAMTSCGWFFDDVAGLEGRQVLRYVAHAIALAGPEAGRLEAGFLARLGDSRSNDPTAGRTADLFRQAAHARQGSAS
jgi:alpha-amylase/alpha-mannosidase (GH57 family)